MAKKIVETFTATVAVGTKHTATDMIQLTDNAIAWLQEYVDKVGLCVTVTRTEYIYSKGREPGLLIGLINYPRFPASKEDIKNHAMVIAESLKEKLRQKRVSIICSDETITIGEL